MSVVRFDDRRGQDGPRDLPAPSDVLLEQSILGAILIRNENFHTSCSTLLPEHFAEEVHQRIFSVITAEVRRGEVANPVTLKTRFGADELVPGMTVPQYLGKLSAAAVRYEDVGSYVRQLIEMAGRRRLAALHQARVIATIDPPAGSTLDTLIDESEAQLAAVRASMPSITITRGLAADFAENLLTEVEDVRQGRHEHVAAPTTGIPDLDRDTGGFEPGTLWIVAGRPGMGKTIAATNFARAAAASGNGALLFSLEVPRRQLIARVLSDLSFNATQPIPFGDILRGRFDDRAHERLIRATERLQDMPLVLDCASRLTVSQIASRVRAEKLRMSRHGQKLGVVLIDYLKFVSATDRYAGQRHYEVGEISGALKALAKDEDICVVLLAQLNRQVESRQDKRPDLHDLRESGDLEADADVVAFIYREAYYVERSPDYRNSDADAVARALDVQNDLELIVGKNRAGQTRTHKLWVHVPCSLMSARDRGQA